MADGRVPEGSCPGCITPSWTATALHLLLRHQATQLLVSSWWLGEPPELVLKPSLKAGVCELQIGGQCWQKLALRKGSSECWLQVGGQHDSEASQASSPSTRVKNCSRVQLAEAGGAFQDPFISSGLPHLHGLDAAGCCAGPSQHAAPHWLLAGADGLSHPTVLPGILPFSAGE